MSLLASAAAVPMRPERSRLNADRSGSGVGSAESPLEMTSVSTERTLFVALAAVLVGFGILMVHTASITSRPTEFEEIYLSRHLVFLTIGVVAASLAAHVRSAQWQRFAPLLFAGTLVLLALVLIPGIGTRVKGAQRWIRLSFVSVQPAEICKVTLTLVLATLVHRRRAQLRHWWRGTVPLVMPVILAVPFILLQPDLGTSLFLSLSAGGLLFVAGWPLRNFLIGLAVLIPPLIWLVLNKPYQLQRITGFIATWSDWSNAPYQLKQSLVTLGAGGFWGVGLGRGYQKLSFLPEANTDFVFAVIGEEVGLVGSLAVLACWGGLYICGLRMIHRLPRDSFEFLASFTLLHQLLLQVLINVAVVTALVPPKGIPHPLLSCGGSNLVMSLVTLGLILGLSDLRRGAAARG